ncbi:MAG: hypothetical protein WDN03_17940 [Rhizomicrobium sp.]
MRKIVVAQLGGRVALDRQRQVAGVHAVAVVLHQDEIGAAIRDRDVDPRCAGIQRVLDQLLRRRGRPLHHLAGGDAVHGPFREAANLHGGGLYTRRHRGRKTLWMKGF